MRIAMTITMLLLAGCSQGTPEAVYVAVQGEKEFALVGQELDRTDLARELHKVTDRHGYQIPLVLIAESEDTPYCWIRIAIDTARSAGFWSFRLGTRGNAEQEEAFYQQIGQMAVPWTFSEVDLVSGRCLRGGNPVSLDQLKSLWTETDSLHRVTLVVSDTTTVEQILTQLGMVNQYDRTVPQILDFSSSQANQPSERTR